MCIHLATLQMFRQDLWPVQHTHTKTGHERQFLPSWLHVTSCELYCLYILDHIFSFFSLPSPFSTLITSSFASCHTQSSVSGDMHFRHRCHVAAVIGSRPWWRQTENENSLAGALTGGELTVCDLAHSRKAHAACRAARINTHTDTSVICSGKLCAL